MRSLPVNMTDVSLRLGGKTVLSDVSFTVPRGKITVLVGPNGAGKTTTVRLVTGAMQPQTGSVATFGVNPCSPQGSDVRKLIGVVSAKPALYDKATGRENLVYAAKIYDVPAQEIEERVVYASAMFGIEDALSQRVGSYSTGMKTRLALARSVLHDPEMLIYDEPTSGLDPESSRVVLELIRSMASTGKTVLMCTHLLAEAENISNQVVLLAGGKVRERGTKEELIKKFFPEKLVSLSLRERTTPVEVLDALRRDTVGVLGVSRFDGDPGSAEGNGEGYVISYDDPATPDAILVCLVEQGFRPTKFVPSHPMLEDIYFAAQKSASGGQR